MIEEIYDLAKKAGACDENGLNKIIKSSSIEELIELMLTPQGIEFCIKNDFPPLSIKLKYEQVLRDKNIFISGKHTIINPGKVLIFGGDVTIVCYEYEVCEIYATNQSRVKVVANDNAFIMAEIYREVEFETESHGLAKVKIIRK